MKLRLLKIAVQPMFVLDDGERLVEQPGVAFEITEADLDGFVEKFRADVATLAAQVERGNVTPSVGDRPAPNRAVRRAKPKGA